MTASPPETRAARHGPDRDWLLGLATALQTSLDVETLVRLFSRHVASLVPHDDVEFVASDDEITAKRAGGAVAEHRCSYDVIVQERQLGTIAFTRSRPFEPGELSLLEVALANLVHPLRNALLYREAVDAAAKDPLTGLSNRTSLDGILEREVELARRHGNAFSVAMLDLDHFKQLNDRHGHLAGDRALVEMARRVRAHVRDSDIVFRYGGEEFCVLLSNTALDGALTLGERIRAAVARTRVSAGGDVQVQVTMSIGVAELRPGMCATDLVSAADRALYAAKHAGRDRVEAAEP